MSDRAYRTGILRDSAKTEIVNFEPIRELDFRDQIYLKVVRRRLELAIDLKELDDDDTKLVPLKNDETPYLEVKTYTQYGMDNNKKPPEQIIVKEEVKYVLHVLQDDIDKVLKLENEE